MRSLSNILDLPSLGEPGPKPMSATNMKDLNTTMAKMTEQNRKKDFCRVGVHTRLGLVEAPVQLGQVHGTDQDSLLGCPGLLL